MTNLLKKWKTVYGELLGEETLSPRLQKTLLALILLACLAIRLATIKAPGLDRTFWKEIDYITISTNYWHHGFNFFHPQINWPAFPSRITAMEFPLVPYLAGLLYPVFGFNPYSVRVIPLIAYLLMALYVFRLTKRETNSLVALLAALACAIMPLYNMFGRLLFSDPVMIALCVVALFHFAEFIEHERKKDGVLALISFTLAVALKLEPLYLVIPLLWIAFRKFHFEWKRYAASTGLFLLSLILPLLWYAYAYHLAHTYIDVFGVFGGLGHTGHDKFQSLTMLREAQWYQVMGERLAGILAGKIGILLLGVGTLAALVIRRGGLFFAYLGSVFFYFGVVAEGQIDAPYRQLAAIPIFAIFIALGALAIYAALITLIPSRISFLLSRRLAYLGFIVGALLICLMAYQRRNDVFTANPQAPADVPRWELAQAIKKYATPSTKLVAAGEYSLNRGGNDLSPVLYYYSGLQGWTLQRPDWHLSKVRSLIAQGGTLFAAIQMSREPDSAPFLQEMRAHYRGLYSCDDAFLLDLTKPAQK